MDPSNKRLPKSSEEKFRTFKYQPANIKHLQLFGLTVCSVIFLGTCIYAGSAEVGAVYELAMWQYLYGDEIFLLCHAAVLSVIMVLSIYATIYLLQDKLVAMPEGIKLPFHLQLFSPRKSIIPWSEILSWDIDGQAKQATLVIKTKKKNFRLRLSDFSTIDECQRFMIQLRAQCPALRDNFQPLLQLNSSLRSEPQSEGSRSYTELWMEGLQSKVSSSSSTPLVAGDRLHNNRIQVLDVLSSAGLLATYLCLYDHTRLVILREYRQLTNSTAAEKALEMLHREGELLLKLNHPGLAKVLDIFDEQNRSYLVMEYKEGQTLKEIVTVGGPASLELALDWIIELARIVQYLHHSDPIIIHRDITPENIVVNKDNQISLIDFGTANRFSSGSTGTVVGKTSYMAPEQFKGKFSEQTDLYSLACVAYFLVTGREPIALIPCALKAILPQIPENLDKLISKTTSQNPSTRTTSIDAFLDELKLIRSTIALQGMSKNVGC